MHMIWIDFCLWCSKIVEWIPYSIFILLAEYAYKAIDALPVSAHPMTQFSTGVMALQVER